MLRFLHYSLLLGLLWLNIACMRIHFVRNAVQFYKVETVSSQDTSVDKSIAPYKNQIDAEMNKVVGKCSEQLNKAQPESALGNWIADVILAQTNLYTGQTADFSVINYGGIRIPSLPQGEITKGKIFELMPFDNMLVMVELSGKDVAQLFDVVATKGGWPVSGAVRLRLGKDNTVKAITVNGQALDPNKTYKIATIDYLAGGGDNCSFFIGKPRTETGKILRMATIEYLDHLNKNGEPAGAKVEGRVVLE